MIHDLERDLGFDDALAMDASRVRIRVDKRRYGKEVTVLDGFDDAIDLAPIAKGLKQGLGTGGTVKERTIELQGDHRIAAATQLRRIGFTVE